MFGKLSRKNSGLLLASKLYESQGGFRDVGDAMSGFDGSDLTQPSTRFLPPPSDDVNNHPKNGRHGVNSIRGEASVVSLEQVEWHGFRPLTTILTQEVSSATSSFWVHVLEGHASRSRRDRVALWFRS